MKDCVKLATQVIELLNEHGADGPEKCAALVTALALVATVHKQPGVSTAKIRERCLKHLGAAIDVLHVAREASSPGR